MFYKNVVLILFMFNFYLVQSKEFKLVYKKDKKNKKNFRDARNFCQKNYPNAELARIFDQESNEKIKRLVYEVGKSKFY